MKNRRIKDAVILAGGKGTRLKSILNGLPKPLVEISGQPLLKYQIDFLLKYNINNIVILANHKIDKIREFIGINYKDKNNTIKILDDGEKQLGTAGAIIKHQNILAENFFIIYGDTYFDINLDAFEDFHFENKSDLTLFVHPNSHPYDSDLVEIDNNNLVNGINSYPHSPDFFSRNLVNAAFLIGTQNIFNTDFSEENIIDLTKDFVPSKIKSNKIFAYESVEYIKDCGTLDRIVGVEKDIKNDLPFKKRLQNKKAIVVLDRDGTIIENIDHLKSIDEISLFDFSCEAIKKLNSNGYLSCVATNQPVVARGEIDEDQLKLIHNYIEWQLGKGGAFIDCIKYCVHHPDCGFEGEIESLKFQCSCRKPEVGMVEEIFQKFNGSKKLSWIIGDTTSDILCGINYGIKTILLRTGFAGKDFKYECYPDYEFSNLLEASEFIVKGYQNIYESFREFHINIKKDIFISGAFQSGKSVIAQVLKDYLQNELNIKSEILSVSSVDFGNCYKCEDASKEYINTIKKLLDIRFNNGKTNQISENDFQNIKSNSILNNSMDFYKNTIIIWELDLMNEISRCFSSENQFFVQSSCEGIHGRQEFKLRSMNFSPDQIHKIMNFLNQHIIRVNNQKRYCNIINN